MIKVNGTKINQKYFPDKTFLLNGVIPTDESWLKNITWHYENESEFALLFYITKFLKDNGGECVLYLPYVPNARMDRIKNDNEVFTLKYFCEFINSLNFSSVVVNDVHSNVTLALLNNVENIYPPALIEVVDKINSTYMPGETILFFPDEGAAKRYSEIYKCPYTFGIKNRDWKTGKIIGLDVFGNVSCKNVIMVDDICSYGGTFLHSARKLKEDGADDIYLVVTHCENSIFDGELINSGLLKHIYTTDSIYNGKNSLITTVSYE